MTRMGLHALVLKKPHSFFILSSATAVYSPLCSSSYLFNGSLPDTQSALIGQLTHGWDSAANNNGSFLTSQTSCLAQEAHTCDFVWCHKITELTTWLLKRRFRSSIFCGREELPRSFACKIYIYIKTLTERTKMKKNNRSPSKLNKR